MDNERRKRNKAKKHELIERKKNVRRRKAGLNFDEEETELASHFRRVIAYSIDQLLFILFLVTYSFILSIVFDKPPEILINSLVPSIIFGAGYISYSIGEKGATYGCRKVNIVVIDVNGRGVIGYQRAFHRWFFLTGIISILSVTVSANTSVGIGFLIGIAAGTLSVFMYIPAFFTPLRQGLHDRISGSIVVKKLDLEG